MKVQIKHYYREETYAFECPKIQFPRREWVIECPMLPSGPEFPPVKGRPREREEKMPGRIDLVNVPGVVSHVLMTWLDTGAPLYVYVPDQDEHNPFPHLIKFGTNSDWNEELSRWEIELLFA